MTALNKPTWWGPLSNYYTFPNDSATTLDSGVLRQTLTTYLTGHFTDLLSPTFLSSQRVVKNTSSDVTRAEINIASPTLASMVIGRQGSDYLAGSSADDILYGDANNDYFVPLGGEDLILGSTSLNADERDTVTYEMSLTGIVVDHTDVPPGPDPLPYHAYYSASYNSWASKTLLNITGFITGKGGDILNMYDLLSRVGYTGTDPVADKYIILLNMNATDMKIQFDPDGKGRAYSASSAVVLRGVTVDQFSIADNLVTNQPPPPPAAPIPPHESDYTIVSNDGMGGVDTLYSVENIIGSNFNDVIHGRDDAANLLVGGNGDDMLYGEGGNDTMLGGRGNDVVDGGAGDDIFMMGSGQDAYLGGAGKDTYKFGSDYLADTLPKSSSINDFQTGANGDKINVAELLRAVHYTGSDPLNDGYINIRQGGTGTEIYFDKDGASGPAGEELLTTLSGVNVTDFSTADNLVTSGKKIIIASTLGQSNSSNMRILSNDSESGLTRIESGLKTQAGFNEAYTVMKDKKGVYLDTAIGGSVVNGDMNSKPDATWWYPSKNAAGNLLIRAADMILTQINDLRAKGAVTPVLIWGQGESDAYNIGSKSTAAAREAMALTYKNATLAVFNYLIDRLGSDVQIYMMQTGNFNTAGAHAAGIPQSTIDATNLGLNYVRTAQQELAMAHKNLHLAVNYADLPMLADMPNTTPGWQTSWPKDQWHLDYDAYEVVGDRLSDFIALDLGYDHIINNPGPYPMHLLSDLTIHAGAGLTLQGNANDNIITGTTGNDDISGDAGIDAIVTGAGDDRLEGGNGADILNGGTGADTFVFLDASAYSGMDTIQDFQASEGDKIDVQNLLTLYQTNGGDLASFVRITEDGLGNSIVSVDRDGSGTAYDFVDIVKLSNVAGLSGNMTILVTGNPPLPPDIVTAQDDVFTENEDTTVLGNLFADNGNGADTQSNGKALSVLAASLTTAMGGTVLLSENGNFQYMAAANFFGMDSFTYTVRDENGNADTATVTINIAPVNDIPDAVDDAFTTMGDTISGNLFTNDTDIDGDALTTSPGIIHTQAQGIVYISETGDFSYAPMSGNTGSDSFSYSVQDGHGGMDNATVTIEVAAAGAYYGDNNNNIIMGSGSNIYGLDGNDIILGTSSNDRLYGGNGNDLVTSGDGNDLVLGNDGTDALYGGKGNDILIGGDIVLLKMASGTSFYNVNALDGADTLYGGEGNDILVGGKGADTLYGDSGADTFMLLSMNDAGDNIADFRISEGDSLDISALIESYDPLTQAISDFVSLTQDQGSTIVSVDADGGGDNFQQVATLSNSGSLDLNDLVSRGNLIV